MINNIKRVWEYARIAGTIILLVWTAANVYSSMQFKQIDLKKDLSAVEKRLNIAEDSLTRLQGQRSEDLSKAQGQHESDTRTLESLKTDMTWVKNTLDRIDKKLDSRVAEK